MHDAMPRPGRRAGRFAAALLAAALMAPPAWAAGGEPGRPTSLLPEAGVRPAAGAALPLPSAKQAAPLPAVAPPPAAASLPIPSADRAIHPLLYRQGGPAGGGLTGRVVDPAGTMP